MKFETIDQVLSYLQKWNEEHPNEPVIHPSFITDVWPGYNDLRQLYRMHHGFANFIMRTVPTTRPRPVTFIPFPSEYKYLETNLLCLQRSPEFENFRLILALVLMERALSHYLTFLDRQCRERMGQMVKAFEEKEAKEAADASQ